MLSSWRMYEMHPDLSFKTGCDNGVDLLDGMGSWVGLFLFSMGHGLYRFSHLCDIWIVIGTEK
jgi:hypothetical protein